MMSNRNLVTICALTLGLNLALIVLFVKYRTGETCYITIDDHQPGHVHIPDNFLSVGIDTTIVQNYDRVDFSDRRLRQLASLLAPARLRLGGTMSERLIFSKHDIIASCDHCPKDEHHGSVCQSVNKLCSKFLPFFLMTGNEWTKINEFCKATKMKLLFSFNALLRDDNNEWNTANARELLDYSMQKKYQADWQLGNEPNSYLHVFNINLTPKKLANDFHKLRQLLNDVGYNKSLLVGPDTTRPQPNRPYCMQYMEEFLSNGSKHINAIAWHQYYLNGRNTSLEEFWNPDTFDLLKKQIHTMRNHTKNYKHMPMWLSETSSAYGSGAPGLSNSFAGSPLWIDKLGLAAKHNISTVIRQSLIGGDYSLINDKLEPSPDWWISVLYKKLVGHRVLHLTCKCSRYQRLYAHCASKKYTHDRTAVTVFGVNLEMAKVRFLLNGTALDGEHLSFEEYIISAPSNNRRSKTVMLNGWPLYYENSLPPLDPVHLRFGNHLSMPPYSIAFWVIKNTSIKACK